MKLTKKVLSIALALIMVIGCVAVSVSADYFSDLESDKYDSNIVISYDQYIRDYSYGTGISAHCPQQVTFNEDGWMRIQSQTEVEEAAYLEAKAAGDTAAMEANEGTYEHQWQLLFKPTEEYQKQFKNAMLNAYNGDGVFAFYTYIASAKLANPKDNTYNTSPTIDVAYSFVVKADLDDDGEYETKIPIEKVQNNTVKHAQYEYQYMNTIIDASELLEIIDYGCDFKLDSICIYPQNYAFDKGSKNDKGQEGVGLLDIYVSPCYVDHLPGYDYDMYGVDAFNAPAELEPSTFTIGDKTGKIKPEDWQWKGWVQTENEDNEPVFGELGDLLRDENGCPIMENGESYIPVPIVKIGSEEEVVCSNLKATVSGSSVTLTWDYTGHPTNFVIYEASGKYYNDSVDTNSITLTDLEPGTYNFSVAGINAEGTEGVESNEVEVKIDSSNPGTSNTPSATSTTTTTTTTTTAKPTNPIAPTQSSKVTTTTKASIAATVKVPSFKLVKGKKQFKVNYKAAAGTAGFQVRYKLANGKWKTKTFKTTKNAVKVIKKLKKGTYSVQIRAFNSSKKYSKWTKSKKVKVK